MASSSHSQQRHLKELLREDQEPFLLTSYIADKQCQLKKQPSLRQQVSTHKTHNLQLRKKPKQNGSFPSHLCKTACFFSSIHGDSPDYIRKSPLLSPVTGNKSPSRALFLHVPAKTAALLLEAATRIQKNSSASASTLKPKTQLRSSGIGLLGSMIKRLTSRARTRKVETGDPKAGEFTGAGDDVIKWADSVKTSSSGRRSSTSKRDEIRVGLEVGLVEKTDLLEDQVGISNGRLSSVWSEENKSIASSSSFSCCSRSASRGGSGNLSEEEGEEEIGCVKSSEKESGSNGDDEFSFCLSQLGPFRFALYNSPSPEHRSPAFPSPVNSPSLRKCKDDVNYEQDPSVKFQAEDEDEKEQSSPVSVLDPPFGDDECEEEDGDCHQKEDGFDVECSYAFVQRAKQQLLQKLRKFEKLAELDPIELEKRMVEEQDGDEFEDLGCEADNDDDDDDDDFSSSIDLDRNLDGYLIDHGLLKPGMKRLLSDLISEEEKAECSSSRDSYESIVKRVCNRLESWKEVEPNTIDMMVSMDLKGESSEWKNPREEISQTAKLVEFSIFAVLIEELLDELTTSSI